MAPKRCPPGIWCLTPTFAISIVIFLAVLLFIVFSIPKSSPTIIIPQTQPQPQPVPLPSTKQETKIFVDSENDRYRRPPEPYRSWATTPDLRGALIPQGAVPIFQPARGGYPDQFQQMGIINVETSNQILPLYGRRAGNRSDRYNYYTRTDTYNPIQLPIHYERRDCMDDVGCQELFGGEKIKIDGLNSHGSVKVYKYDAPRYIPSVF